MKLKDLRDIDPPANLKKIDVKDTETIWVSGYWDGALSGLLQMNKEFFWFEMTQENDEWKSGEWWRRFAIVKLNKNQLKKEFKVHEDFQRYVGAGYDEKFIKTPPKFEEGKMNKFYDQHLSYTQSNPFEENEVIGWIEK